MSLLLAPSSIDDIFGKPKKKRDAAKFKESFNGFGGSTNAVVKSHQVEELKPPTQIPARKEVSAPPEVQRAKPLPPPPNHYQLAEARERRYQEQKQQAVQKGASNKPIPSYLRPRAPVASREEVEAREMMSKARNLVSER